MAGLALLALSGFGQPVFFEIGDSLGNIQWEQWQGGTDNDYGFTTHQLPDGTYIMSGDTRSFGSGGYDVNLTRMDASGSPIWNY